MLLLAESVVNLVTSEVVTETEGVTIMMLLLSFDPEPFSIEFVSLEEDPLSSEKLVLELSLASLLELAESTGLFITL